MAKKIIFFFPPTGLPGKDYENEEMEKHFPDDVIRVYLKECGNENIGNSQTFPDFNIVAQKIAEAFNNNKLDIAKLEQNLGTGIVQIKGLIEKNEPPIEIERIALQGYSRGAMAVFAVAKKLDKLNIPLDVLADRPVPGEFGSLQPFSTYSTYLDLSSYQNIKTSTTLIAAHHLQHPWWHNIFFKQLLPTYSSNTKTNNILIPYSFHFAPNFKAIPIAFHMLNQFHKLGYLKPELEDSDQWANAIKNNYEYAKDIYYTPQKYLQKVYGSNHPIAKDPYYLAMIQEKAKSIMDKEGILEDRNISDDQAKALCILDDLSLDEKTKKSYGEFVLSSTPNALKFTQVLNEVEDACKYLIHTNPSKNNHKSDLVEKFSHDYKNSVFTLTYDYLQDDKGDTQKSIFIKGIKNAQKIYEDQALGIDRGKMRKALSIITNGILFITGTFLFANGLNKALTGNWLFFSKTRSAKTMQETIDETIKFCTTQPKG